MDVRSALMGSGLPQSDAETLLAFVMQKDRTWALSHPEYKLAPELWKKFQDALERRRSHEPVPYITGTQEFYGRDFTVDQRVLIPRPATEGLVELALAVLQSPSSEEREVDSGIVAVSMMFPREGTAEKVSLVADIGTGSGAIAVTLACERPDLRVIATDISSCALDVARENAKRSGALDRMEFLCGDGFAPLHTMKEPFLVVCNPPYIPRERTLMRDVSAFEPHIALFGGGDGMSVLRSVLQHASKHPACIGVIFECGIDQCKQLRGMLH